MKVKNREVTANFGHDSQNPNLREVVNRLLVRSISEPKNTFIIARSTLDINNSS